jgi:hypothetical protein
MKIRMVVTLDVDPEVWAAEYGIPPNSRAVRDDALMHLRNTVHEHYVAHLGIARDTRVVVESSHRVSNPFR